MTRLPVIALVGNPNCGKSALFNILTGSKQKVANYPGVTVERKEGQFSSPNGREFRLLDLPGAYSLRAERAADERVTRDVILGRFGDDTPELLICVVDSTNLSLNLRIVIELRDADAPILLAINMMDIAKKRGIKIDIDKLSQELGVPVVPTVATSSEGIYELVNALEPMTFSCPNAIKIPEQRSVEEIISQYKEVDRVLSLSMQKEETTSNWTRRLDNIALHRIFGPILLFLILGFVFQAIFTWASVPQDWIENGINALIDFVKTNMSDGPLRGLLTNGVIAGVGSVLVFLPQILLLFFFILLLEDSGYMARAAFIMDRLMSSVGLNGRAFIPLLSSFACAIPGIMATRTISDWRDRLTTILIAPLMTCAARLPVYSLLIAAFIPNTTVFGPIRLQGLVMLGLYVAGIGSALIVARVLKWSVLKGPRPLLLMEIPTYRIPSLRSLAYSLWDRTRMFLEKAGTIILALMIILWFLATYPQVEGTPDSPAIVSSFAGKIGTFIAPVLHPLGFDWRIAIAMVPGFAAREVLVGALGTVFAIENTDSSSTLLTERLLQSWSLPTALSLLVFYIFAPQCLSTLVVTRRETNSWKWPLFMLFYLSIIAYGSAFLTFQISSYLLGL